MRMLKNAESFVELPERISLYRRHQNSVKQLTWRVLGRQLTSKKWLTIFAKHSVLDAWMFNAQMFNV